MDDKRLLDLMAEIHKQLVMIATHLATLAQAAQHEHPEAFKGRQAPRVPESRS
jgi:chemotaxis regulatin CheY-phosphate phosphatase CheZ